MASSSRLHALFIRERTAVGSSTRTQSWGKNHAPRKSLEEFFRFLHKSGTQVSVLSQGAEQSIVQTVPFGIFPASPVLRDDAEIVIQGNQIAISAPDLATR